MFMRTFLLSALSSNDCEYIDNVSLFVKALCTLVYIWTVSKFHDTHLQFILDPPCHAYVPQGQAIIEYIVISSYLIFHLTHLIDIRNIRFLCYPRTCSGECEPLKPENFQSGHKYECCRSYELRQRQVLGQST
uniref:Uncharacterized protein n=1 Tax=Panagrolaimus superbus TaxID=310955 RepID=A0A914XTD2_9BILA